MQTDLIGQRVSYGEIDLEEVEGVVHGVYLERAGDGLHDILTLIIAAADGQLFTRPLPDCVVL